jgi:pimeloyl-ACP methyl ester carboxylesterase
MLFATAYPQRVTRLVLNDCAMSADAAGMNEVANRPSVERYEFDDIEEAMFWFVSDRPGLDRLGSLQVRRWVEGFLSRAENGKLRLKCDPCIVREAGAMAQRLAAAGGGFRGPEQAWEQAKRLTMPVLLLRGALSKVVTAAVASRVVSVLPSARCVEIPGAGHCPTLYEPEARAALIDFFGLDFLGRDSSESAAHATAACETNWSRPAHTQVQAGFKED